MECEHKKCGINAAVEVIGNKWNLIIIWRLQDGPMRFTDIQKSIGDINSKTVTKHLRVLEKYKLITRTVFPEVPPRVEYSLTEHGTKFLPIFEAINQWGQSLPGD